MAAYPDALPTLREVENDPGVAYDPLQKNVVFAEDTNNIAAEILAIATELGTLPKGTFADVKARLADMTTKTATAQSTANSKANKQNNVMVYLGNTGYLDYSKTWSSPTNGTAYWIEMPTSSSPWTLTITGAHTNCRVDFTAKCLLNSVNWVELQLWIDGAAESGWFNWTAENNIRMTEYKSMGFSLTGTGSHTIQWKWRTTNAAITSVRIDQPSMRVWKYINI